MKKIPKIIVCLLLIVLALSFTACTQKAATEQEVRTVELDGLKYSIINTLDGDTVTDTYAKVTGYVGAAENVTIPATVEDIKVLTIGGLAFYSKTVKSITLPEGVTTIENFAFGYSDIISVDIPSTVTRIGDYAFIHCLWLKEVVIAATKKPEVGQYTFKFYNTDEKEYSVRSDLEIKVPSLAAYKPDGVNDYWKEYQSNLKEVA